MVWAVSKIKRAVRLGKLQILEPSGKPMKDIKYGNNGQVSIDVHLGGRYGVWKDHDQKNPKPFDISGRNIESSDEYFSKYRAENVVYRDVSDCGVIVKPGDLYLWPIYEYLKLPNDIFARVETKSKWARIGISTHNCAPAIQPGWPINDSNKCEKLLLEITNTSKTPIVLYPKTINDKGTVVAQIFFEGVTEASTCWQAIKAIWSWLREFYVIYFGWAASKTTIGRAVFFVVSILLAIYHADSLHVFIKTIFHIA